MSLENSFDLDRADGVVAVMPYGFIVSGAIALAAAIAGGVAICNYLTERPADKTVVTAGENTPAGQYREERR